MSGFENQVIIEQVSLNAYCLCLNVSCLPDGTRPHQVRFVRVLVLSGTQKGKYSGYAHLMRTGLVKMTKLGICAKLKNIDRSLLYNWLDMSSIYVHTVGQKTHARRKGFCLFNIFPLMKKILYLLILFPQMLFAQWHDANWHFSGTPNYSQNSPNKSATLNFSGNSAAFSFLFTNNVNNLGSATASDSAGNLIFYTNGLNVFNRLHSVMENGNNLNAGVMASDPSWASGYPEFFTMFCLPGSENKYFLIHARRINECNYFMAADILYTTIDMNANGGLGKVVAKNQKLKGCEIGGWCSISATRHANGRDWWVLASKNEHNRYFRMRFTPEGVADTLTFTVDDDNGIWGTGQSIFTPNGSKYIDARRGRTVRVYDFDRCAGTLGSYQEIYAAGDEPFGLGSGTSISQDSRYLYAASNFVIVQADLTALDIPAMVDTIAVFDGFYDDDVYHLCALGEIQMMPNGIIYGVTPAYNRTRYLHQVRFPNRKGLASQPLLHSIRSPISVGTIPIFPNYRLGPLDGSSCDTLGIDNLPLAHFRWDVEDTLSPLAVSFTDLSYYEPATWAWSFGDPASGAANMSQDTSQVHTFAAPGTYNVCLVACNANACDTVCKVVVVGLSSVGDEPAALKGDAWWVWPNPVRELLHIATENRTGDSEIQISNMEGKVLVTKRLDFLDGQATVSFAGLPQGVYLLRMVDSMGVRNWVQRVVKM